MMRVSGAYIRELRPDYDAKAVIGQNMRPLAGLPFPHGLT
jgi:hypothetical protein